MTSRRYEMSNALMKRICVELTKLDRTTLSYQDVREALDAERVDRLDAVETLITYCLTNDEADNSKPGRFQWLGAAIGRACAYEARDLRRVLSDLALARLSVEDAIERRWPRD